MTAEKWWYEVILKTFQNTENLNQIEPDELIQLMSTVFKMLYHDVFSTKAGWIIKEDVEYTLNKLVEWRDQGSGPKLGIISNTDDRLSAVLSGTAIGL
jgi:hypothetical protein